MHHTSHNTLVPYLVSSAIRWFKVVQNSDGGFGEDLHSYKDPRLAGRGASTVSQTAWGAMALLAHLPASDEAVKASIAYLVSAQTKKRGHGATWLEREFTGTGFPNLFYIGYSYYSHYFPMMALGRYQQKLGKQPSYTEKEVEVEDI